MGDTIVVLSEYADAIIMRSDHEGMALEAAHASRVPILNAGDGAGEHPTQTLLDLYTLREFRKEGLDGIILALVGDLKFGRTVRSLARAMRCYDNVKLFLVAPEIIQMEQDVLDDLDAEGINYELVDGLDPVLAECDAVYMTRAQLERHPDTQLLKKLDLDPFSMTAERAEKMPEHGIIMHPLPRLGEIKKDVDTNPRAKYFHPQVRNGMLTRMAELYHCVLAAYKQDGKGQFELDEKFLLKELLLKNGA